MTDRYYPYLVRAALERRREERRFRTRRRQARLRAWVRALFRMGLAASAIALSLTALLFWAA